MGRLGGFRCAAGAAGQLSARTLPAARTLWLQDADVRTLRPGLRSPAHHLRSRNARKASRKYREFIDQAADIVLAHGGSLSGEHGDGQARGALLPKMYGPELMKAFQEFKALWDPDNRMNPGKMIDPVAVYDPADNLRLGAGYQAKKVDTWFQYPLDPGGFGETTLRCVGVGACRKQDHGTMCPSYMATREEKHSTRGRAHLLWEMLQGQVITRRMAQRGGEGSARSLPLLQGLQDGVPGQRRYGDLEGRVSGLIITRAGCTRCSTTSSALWTDGHNLLPLRRGWPICLCGRRGCAAW